MCYSAQVEQRFQAYVRRFGADIDIHEFVRRYGARAEGERFKTARGLGWPRTNPFGWSDAYLYYCGRGNKSWRKSCAV